MKLKKIIPILISKKNTKKNIKVKEIKKEIKVLFIKNQDFNQALFIENTKFLQHLKALSIEIWKSLKPKEELFYIYTRNFNDVRKLVFINVELSLILIFIKIKELEFIKNHKQKKLMFSIEMSDKKTNNKFSTKFYCCFNFYFMIPFILGLTALKIYKI